MRSKNDLKRKAERCYKPDGTSPNSAIMVDDDATLQSQGSMPFDFGQGQRGSLTRIDIDILMNGGRLNSSLIWYGMLRLVQKDATGRFHCIDPLLTVNGLASFRHQYVFMPVCEDDHWYLIIITWRPRNLVVLDSLGTEHSHGLEANRQLLSSELQLQDSETIYVERLPIQSDSDSCGLYVLDYIEHFIDNPEAFINNNIEPWEVNIDGRRKWLLNEIGVEFNMPKLRGRLPSRNSTGKRIKRAQPADLNVGEHTFNGTGNKKSQQHLKTTSTPISSRDDRWPPDVAKFLKIDKGPLLHLAQAFRKVMDNAKPLQQAENVLCDLQVPFLLPTAHCWNTVPQWESFFNTLITTDGWEIYQRGAPDYDLGRKYTYRVIQQLFEPDEAHCYFATNIILPCGDPTAGNPCMVIPESITAHWEPWEDNLQIDTNLTPRSAFADIHIDKGYHVLTSLISPENGSLKIFLFWPPTRNNLMVLNTHRHLRNWLTKVDDKLENPMYAILDRDTSVCIPSGWLHATFTLKRCAVPSMVFCTANSLNMTVTIMEKLKDANEPYINYVPAFVESLMVAIVCKNDQEHHNALEKFTQWERLISMAFENDSTNILDAVENLWEQVKLKAKT